MTLASEENLGTHKPWCGRRVPDMYRVCDCGVLRGDGFVYVATYGPYVKVGRSREPYMRLVGLAREAKRLFGKGHEVKLITAVHYENPGLVETKIHCRLGRFRKIGEWYDGLKVLKDAKTLVFNPS